jgi:hypothetical protein
LILSVERMLFKDHKYAASWKYVRFGEDEAEILDEDKTPLQKIKITEFQRMILNSHKSFINAEIDRRKLKAETGKWTIPDDLNKPDEMSEGGEALVLTQKFEDFPIAVRVHIFDPYLFTAQFPSDKVTSKAHFEKGKFVNKEFPGFLLIAGPHRSSPIHFNDAGGCVNKNSKFLAGAGGHLLERINAGALA